MGLVNPIEIANARDGSGRLFIVEQAGRIRILQNGTVLTTPFLDLTAIPSPISAGGERGLLGLAFHPQYRGNGAFYVFYTRAGDGALTIARYLRKTANANEADPLSAAVILTIPHPTNSNHNGGHLAFGPDGYLYIGTGDGGGSNDTLNNAQTLSRRLGKLLRISVDGGTSYTIPLDNPFAQSTCDIVADTGICPEIWAYGLRNPWKFSFDRVTGDLFIGDVGQGALEEIDFEPAGDAGGRNYGWKVFEGTQCRPPTTGCSLSNHTPPILEYGRSLGSSVTGGYRYRGKKSSPLRGYYLYGDYVSRRMWAAQFDGGWSTSVLLEPASVPSNISTFGEDEAGEIYLAGYGNGRIYAIDGPGPRIETRGDFDGNGRSDILWRNNGTGENAIWQMDGTTLAGNAFIPSVTAAGWTIAGQGDFNGDGKADILWRNTSTGDNAIWLMNGFTLAGSALIPSMPTTWSIAGVGDFDGNGKSDILWRDSTGQDAIWLMNGTALDSGALIPSVPTTWSIAGVGDFDSDGKSDILWRDNTGQNAIWLMNGTMLSSSTLILSVPTPWAIAGVGDFDGDGKADILWRDNTGQNAIWLMNGTALASSALIPSVPATWAIAGTGDYDGDGKADLLWRDSTGLDAIWLMSGFSLTSSALIPGAPTSWSAINTR